MSSLATEERQERLRSLVDDWVSRQAEDGSRPLHQQNHGDLASSAPAVFFLPEDPFSWREDCSLTGDILEDSQAPRGAMLRIVTTLSDLCHKTTVRCDEVYQQYLPALLVMGILPEVEEGRSEPAQPATHGATEPSRAAKLDSQSAEEGALRGGSGPRRDGEGATADPGAPRTVVADCGSKEAAGDEEIGDRAGVGGREGEQVEEGREEEWMQGGPGVGMEHARAILSAPLTAHAASDVPQDAGSGNTAVRTPYGARPRNMLSSKGGMDMETAAMIPCLQGLARTLEELALLLENLLQQLHALYPPPQPPPGLWGALFSSKEPKESKESKGRGSGPRAQPKPFTRFQGKVHLPCVVRSMARVMGVFLAVTEGLKFNKAVTHGLSSYLQLLTSSLGSAFDGDLPAGSLRNGHHLPSTPSFDEGVREPEVDGALRGSDETARAELQELQASVGQLFATLLPPRGLFTELLLRLQLRSHGSGSAPSVFENETLLAELLSVTNTVCSELLEQIPDSKAKKRALQGPLRSKEEQETRVLLSGYLGLFCLLCTPRQHAQKPVLPPKQVTQLTRTLWEAAGKLPMLHLWGPLSLSPLELLATHAPPAVLALAPRPLASLSQKPSTASAISGASTASTASAAFRSLQASLRASALEQCSRALVEESPQCYALLSSLVAKMELMGGPASTLDLAHTLEEQQRVLEQGGRLCAWALSLVQLTLDLHAALERPLPSSRMLPVCSLLIAASAFSTARARVAPAWQVGLSVRAMSLRGELRRLLEGLKGEMEAKVAKSAASAHAIFFGTAPASAQAKAAGTHSQGAPASISPAPASAAQARAAPAGPLQGPSQGPFPPSSSQSEAASTTSETSTEGASPGPQLPDPLALVSICLGVLSPVSPSGMSQRQKDLVLQTSLEALWGLYQAQGERREAVEGTLRKMLSLHRLQRELSHGGGAHNGGFVFLLWRQDQLLPVLLRALCSFSPESGLPLPCVAPGGNWQLLLDCFVRALSPLSCIPGPGAAASAALAAFEGGIVRCLETGLILPLARDIEADLRLHVHAVRLGQQSVRANPRKTGLRDLSWLLCLPPLRLSACSVSVAGRIECQLASALFNQALLCPPGSRQAYVEMRRLAASKYGLRAVDESPLPAGAVLPSWQLDSGSVPGMRNATATASARASTPSLPEAVPSARDVAWILGNLPVFLASFSYSATKQQFTGLLPSHSGKPIMLYSGDFRSQLESLDCLDVLSAVEQAALPMGAALLQQLLHLLSHDTLQTLLTKEERWWAEHRGSKEGGAEADSMSVAAELKGSRGSAPPSFPLERAEAVLGSLSKVKVPASFLLGLRKPGGGRKPTKGEEVLLLDALADVVRQLGVLLALVQALQMSCQEQLRTRGLRGRSLSRPPASTEHFSVDAGGALAEQCSVDAGGPLPGLFPLEALVASMGPASSRASSGRFFLLCPCLTLHRARASSARLGSTGRPNSSSAEGSFSGGDEPALTSSSAASAGSGAGADGFGLGLALTLRVTRQQGRFQGLRWPRGAKGALGERVRVAEGELQAQCRPPVEHVLWGRPVEVLHPERAHHLRGVIAEASALLEELTRLEATMAETASKLDMLTVHAPS